MEERLSVLQKQRQEYYPPLPTILKDLKKINFSRGKETSPTKDSEQLKKLFPLTFGQPLVEGKIGNRGTSSPLRIGVVFSGGQASGGHNVIAGLYDALQALHLESKLFGFLDGPNGILNGKNIEITEELLVPFRNQGGFDLIGSGRTKIETKEQLNAAKKTIESMRLDGLVIIGGDDSNTNAAVLAEYFLAEQCSAKVIGVPKTIDGDLKNEYVATSFGFDTACKVYSELIGNIARDASSAKKYYHFIRLMGRSASHIALECALQVHPNITIIGEEVAARKKTLKDITNEISDVMCKRAEIGKNYGVVLIPEGLIEFIPEVGILISELNQMGRSLDSLNFSDIGKELSSGSLRCFESLPQHIQKQLLLERDPHGNVQVSLIETEGLLIDTVSRELNLRKKNGSFVGKFNALQHFFGYEGRAGFPSNFDAHYCYALGRTAALLLDEGITGYMCCIGNLSAQVDRWTIGGIPLTMLMNIELRHGQSKPVIRKALVNLQSKAFTYFQSKRQTWSLNDEYRFPGPIQFFGDPILTDSIPLTLSLDT
jgi:diphosphate-dependent phosphofructokinase